MHDAAVVVLGVNDTLTLTTPGSWRATVERVIDALTPHLTPGGPVVLAGLPAVGRFTALPQPLRTVLGRHAAALDDTLAALADARAGVLHSRTPCSAPDRCRQTTASTPPPGATSSGARISPARSSKRGLSCGPRGI